MREKSASGTLRWLTAGLLLLAAAPILLTWRASAGGDAVRPNVQDWTAEDGFAWTSPNEIAVQLKPGNDDNALADLGRRIGAPLAWSSALGSETGIARLPIPAGLTPQAALSLLRTDSRVE